MKRTLFVNGRELTRPVLHSMRRILLETVPHLADYFEIVLLSDLPLEKTLLESLRIPPEQNQAWGKPALKSCAHLHYNRWMGQRVRSLQPDFFFEVHHKLLFHPGRTKALVMVHDYYVLEGVESFPRLIKVKQRMSVRKTLSHAHAIMTPSQFSKDSVNRFFSYPEEKIFVNPPGIDHSLDCVSVKPGSLPPGPFLFFVGRISYWKGIDLLIRAMSEKTFPQNINVVLAGNVEARFRPALEKALSSHPRLCFLGRISNEEREHLFRKAEAFIYPTRFEGFGIPPLEAALRECPVLVSDIPIMKEVTHGKAAYFPLEEGAPALARAVRGLLAHPDQEKLREMRQTAESYTWDAFAEKMKEILVEGSVVKGSGLDSF